MGSCIYIYYIHILYISIISDGFQSVYITLWRWFILSVNHHDSSFLRNPFIPLGFRKNKSFVRQLFGKIFFLEWHSSALGPGWFNDSSNFGCIVRWCFCARIKAVANCFFCIFPNEPCCKPPLHVERREVVIRTCISQRKLARKQNTGIPTRKQSLWPHKWSRSGGVSNSLRPCEMKDLSSTAQMM